VAVMAGLAGTYVLAGKLGLELGIVHPSASAVWAPTGIALAAMLALGYGVWPSVFVGAFLVNALTAGSFATSLGIATGNTLEALTAAYLVNRFAGGRNAFDRAPDTFRFALLAGVVSTAVSATVGVTSLSLGGYANWSEFWTIWLTWWLGNMGGALIVAPPLILWSRDWRVRWTRAQYIEAAALLVALVILGRTIFSVWAVGLMAGHPLKFLAMPLLVWAAYRYSPRVASTSLLVLAVVAVTATLGHGGPTTRLELNQSLVLIQIFMAVAATTTLALAAVVSERRRVEQAVQATSTELRQALSELEAFNHAISHDLRSPIGVVLNYSTVIEEDFADRLDSNGVRMLQRIRASAGSAVALLDQLVQAEWVGRGDADPAPVDMNAMARDVRNELLAGGDDAANVHFELHDLPTARGSAPLLRCVLRNLMGNAVKFTRGRRDRRVEVSGTTGAWEHTFTVTDNGIGFDPQHGDAMFQPFRRLAGAGKFEGSGLGLTIAAKIVRRHGGRIWAESDGASGARLSFSLPTQPSAT
jgi:signal transduction histidine kinase